jgi:hypothetical protein
MKFLFVLLLLVSIDGFGQRWKDYFISIKGDTLNRVDMEGKKQGPWVIHVEALRGEPGFDEQGYFVNDKKDGLWLRFSPMGDRIAEENYRWGSLDGKCRYYNLTGALMREESWRAIDPSKDMDTVAVYSINDPTKIIDHVIVKLEGQTNKHGLWTYYDAEWGTIVKTERYWLNKLKTDNEENGDAGGDDIRPLGVSSGRTKSDTAGKKMVKPQAILDYEKKNSGKKKVKTRDGSTGY